MKDIASKQRAPVKADTVICNTLESDLIRKGTQISSLSPCKSILPLCSSTFGQCLTMPCFSFCSCCFSPSVQMLLPSFSSKNHSPWHQNSLSLLSPWAVLAPYSYWSLPKLWIYRRSRKCQTVAKYLSRDLWQGQLRTRWRYWNINLYVLLFLVVILIPWYQLYTFLRHTRGKYMMKGAVDSIYWLKMNVRLEAQGGILLFMYWMDDIPLSLYPCNIR